MTSVTSINFNFVLHAFLVSHSVSQSFSIRVSHMQARSTIALKRQHAWARKLPLVRRLRNSNYNTNLPYVLESVQHPEALYEVTD